MSGDRKTVAVGKRLDGGRPVVKVDPKLPRERPKAQK